MLELLKLTNLGTNSKSPSNNDDEPAHVADMPLDSSSSQACVPPPLEANTSEQSPDGATRGSQIVDEVSDSTLRTNINAAASVPSGEESWEMSLLYAGCSRSKGMPQAEEAVNTTNLIGDR